MTMTRAALLLPLALLAGCPAPSSSDAGAHDAGCACSEGQLCLRGQCFEPSCGATACSSAEVCAQGACVDARCAGLFCPAHGRCFAGTCLSSACGLSACDAGSWCVDSACVEEACIDVRCPSEQRCQGGRCVCAGLFTEQDGGCVLRGAVGDSCSQPQDCNNALCKDGVCCESACSLPCEVCGPGGRCGAQPNGAPGTPACNPGACHGGHDCDLACATDGDCRAGLAVCTSGSCEPKRGHGALCGRDAECASGFCTDGVCCDARCSGPCERCFYGLDAGASFLDGGQWAPVPGVCSAALPSSAPESACRPPDGGALLCDGVSGQCPGQCRTSFDCANRFAEYCDQGTCRAFKAQGAQCNTGGECGVWGACVEGYCCDGACAGNCESCAVPGREGTCTVTDGGLAPGKPQCLNQAICIGGTCCDRACTGGCQSCATQVCQPLAAGTPCGGNMQCLDGLGSPCPTQCTSGVECLPGACCTTAGQCVYPSVPLGGSCNGDCDCLDGLTCGCNVQPGHVCQKACGGGA